MLPRSSFLTRLDVFVTSQRRNWGSIVNSRKSGFGGRGVTTGERAGAAGVADNGAVLAAAAGAGGGGTADGTASVEAPPVNDPGSV